MTDKVELYVDGSIYSGWTSVRINRSLLAMAGSFELSVTEQWPGQPVTRPIKPGQRCRIVLAEQTLIEGHVEDLSIQYDANSHQVTLSGRDLTGDLPDCSILPEQGGELREQTLAGLAGTLCQPFGIKVIQSGKLPDGADKTFATFRAEPGETVFEALERASRQRGVLLTVDSHGRLVMTAPNTGPARYRLALGREMLNANITASHRDRFSLYRVAGLGDAGGEFGDQASAADLAVSGDINDPAIKRFRPKLLQSEDSLGSEDSAKERANWQAARAMASGNRARVTVQGWRAPDGQLWQTNKPVELEDPWLGFQGQPLLIVNVAFSLDDNGTLTELELMPAAGLVPEPLQDEEALW